MSGRIAYGLLYIVLKCIALLPFGVLYILADGLYFLIYRVVGYRRKLVRKNLTLCFPDKDIREIEDIERQFYHNFADYVVETIKLLHISDAAMMRRMSFVDTDILDRLVAEGRDVAVFLGHCGNWEWGTSLTQAVRLGREDKVIYGQVYRPLNNHVMDRLMLKVRSRFGSESYSKHAVMRSLIRFRRDGFRTVTGFMSDQKPGVADRVLVTEFLHRPTAFITGTEELARKLGMSCVYWDIEKPSRGHYRFTCRMLAENPAELPDGEVTRLYINSLANTIRRQPAIWLWTHNRWKNPVTLPQE